MDLGLADSVALVTGGTSGLGLGSACALAREGADVAVCARNAGRLEAAREAVAAAGDGEVLSMQTDVTDDQGEVDELVETVLTTFDDLDHLVVSGAGPRLAAVRETTERDWYVTYDVVVTSVVRLVRQAYPALRDGGGTVTVVGCTAAVDPCDDHALANALYRTVVGLVKTLARELAPAVRVNAALAGPHDTPYFEELVAARVDRGDAADPARARDAVREAVPLGEVGDPAAFGDVAAFLASDRAGFVTGAALPVDGGRARSSR